MGDLKTLTAVLRSDLSGAAWHDAWRAVTSTCYFCRESFGDEAAIAIYLPEDRALRECIPVGTDRRVMQPSAFACRGCVEGRRHRELIAANIERLLGFAEKLTTPPAVPEYGQVLGTEVRLPTQEELVEQNLKWQEEEKQREAERQEQIAQRRRVLELHEASVAHAEKLNEMLGELLVLVKAGAARDGIS